jgi:hypothetical protein
LRAGGNVEDIPEQAEVAQRVTVVDKVFILLLQHLFSYFMIFYANLLALPERS